MKLLIYIFLISLSYVLSDVVDENPKKIVVKSYPKKVKSGLFLINNAGKYIKPKLVTKKQLNEKDYTVFPIASHNAPESLYFQEDELGNKPRVKKVLTDSHFRSKRSVATNKKDNKKVVKPPAKPSNVKSKGHPTQKLKPRPKLRKGVNKRKNVKGRKRPAKRLRRHPRLARLRKGQNRNRKLKYTKSNKHAKLRSGLGNKKGGKALNKKNLANTTKTSKKDARRLIAARDAMIENYPFVVSIQKEREHWCAGALLNPRLIITTANCLWKSNRISRMHVRAGSRHTDRGGQVAYIQEVMKHPGWKIRMDPDNDIALALLDRNIKFSHGVHGVDLPNRVMMPAFEDAWITSWGSERRDGVFESKSNTLQVYHARIMDRRKCNNVTQRFGVAVTDNFVCLAQTGRRAPCTRDTGAPAVSDGVLWGLASWGIRKLCGTERFPAMFSYTASETNLNFIINATYQLMADERFYPFPDKMPRQWASHITKPIPTTTY